MNERISDEGTERVGAGKRNLMSEEWRRKLEEGKEVILRNVYAKMEVLSG